MFLNEHSLMFWSDLYSVCVFQRRLLRRGHVRFGISQRPLLVSSGVECHWEIFGLSHGENGQHLAS